MESSEWLEYDAVESDPDRVSGTVVFRNTRLPVTAVVDNVDSFMDVDGLTLEEAINQTLECYPATPGGASGIRAVLAFRATREHQLQP